MNWETTSSTHWDHIVFNASDMVSYFCVLSDQMFEVFPNSGLIIIFCCNAHKELIPVFIRKLVKDALEVRPRSIYSWISAILFMHG